MKKSEATTEVLSRLKSIEGHVRGIGRMVEEGDYCVDILNQILAVQRALKRVSASILDQHLHTCVTTAIRDRDRDRRKKVLGEILQLFDTSGRT